MVEEYILWLEENKEYKDYVPFSSLLIKRDSLTKGFRLGDNQGIYFKFVFNTPPSDNEIINIKSVLGPFIERCDNLEINVITMTLIENNILNVQVFDTSYFELLIDHELERTIYIDITSLSLLKASNIAPIYCYTSKCGEKIRYSSPDTKFLVCEVSETCVCLDQCSSQGEMRYSGFIHHHQYVHLLLSLDGEVVKDKFLLREECDLIDVETFGSLLNLQTLQKVLTSQQLNPAEYMYLIGKLHQKIYPTLVGLKEFAQILGWTSARVSTLYSRQLKGKVRNPLPLPLKTLASTPIWTSEQALKYKEQLENKSQ